MCERHINQLPLACPLLGTWPATQACALTRNQTRDLLVCRPEFNALSHTNRLTNFKMKVVKRRIWLHVTPEEKGYWVQNLTL